MVQSFFASGLMLKEMNHTFITLIPKTPNPSTIHNFRSKSICSKIDARLQDFFRGFIDSSHHIYPKAWDSLCKPKSTGGLGFHHAHDINNALVSKLGWIIASSANKPWTSLLQSKYLRGRSFLTSTLQQNSSYIWKGIHKSIPLIKKRLLLPHWIRFFDEHLA